MRTNKNNNEIFYWSVKLILLLWVSILLVSLISNNEPIPTSVIYNAGFNDGFQKCEDVNFGWYNPLTQEYLPMSVIYKDEP